MQQNHTYLKFQIKLKPCNLFKKKQDFKIQNKKLIYQATCAATSVCKFWVCGAVSTKATDV